VDRIGPELKKDLDALASLRNYFAHGRSLQFKLPPDSIRESNLDSNNLKQPVERLHAAGIIKKMGFTSRDYTEILAQLYSDDAVLYFHNCSDQIQTALFD
jgi:hypothetical protein